MLFVLLLEPFRVFCHYTAIWGISSLTLKLSFFEGAWEKNVAYLEPCFFPLHGKQFYNSLQDFF